MRRESMRAMHNIKCLGTVIDKIKLFMYRNLLQLMKQIDIWYWHLVA